MANNMDSALEMEQIVMEEQEWQRKVERQRQEQQKREMAAYFERLQEKKGPQAEGEVLASRDLQELKTMIQDVRVFRQYVGFARTEMKYEEVLYLEKNLFELKEKIRIWISQKHSAPKNNHD